jgi:hypothetical protein
MIQTEYHDYLRLRFCDGIVFCQLQMTVDSMFRNQAWFLFRRFKTGKTHISGLTHLTRWQVAISRNA